MYCHLIIVEHNKYKDIEKNELYYDNNDTLFEVLELLYNADFNVKLNLDFRYINNNSIREFLKKIEPDLESDIDDFKEEDLSIIMSEWFKGD